MIEELNLSLHITDARQGFTDSGELGHVVHIVLDVSAAAANAAHTGLCCFQTAR